MRVPLLCLCLFLDGVFGLTVFGKALLKNSELCRPWTTLNNKLFNGSDEPSPDDVTKQLKTLLPEGDWQSVVQDVVKVCYGAEKPRVYTNTCPGQALLHCVVDNLISHCPESSLAKDDACAPLTSLAGFKYMFSQSRYDNMEKYLPTERRPLWFLQNYFSSKCCDVPQLFSSEVLAECGFTSMIHYYGHEPKPKGPHFVKNTPAMVVTTEAHIADKVKVVEQSQPESEDPLDCCDVSEFITPESRAICRFQASWSERQRLVIADNQPEEAPTTTKSPPALKHHDVKVVPLSCEKETCVFRQLNIISDSGSVDTGAFSHLLDNLTSEHPEWVKAKARVVTRCLTKPIRDYDDQCEINKVLSCTFDVLTENCPHAKKATADPCKHTYSMKNDTICQINSSKFRPKNRRQYCDFPRFVSHEVLAACDISSINQVEKAAPPVLASPPRKFGWWPFRPAQCSESKPATNCLLSKMNVLSKYNFLDYFKMKDRIRQFTADNAEWSNLRDVYVATLTGMPMYRESCASQRKLLNVVDAMLMTCPVSRRKNTDQCNKMFSEMIQRAPEVQQSNIKQTFAHNLMMPPKIFEVPRFGPPLNRIPTFKKEHGSLAKPDEIPPVRIMHIKPQKMIVNGRKNPESIHVRTPLVVTPVYMGMATPTESIPVTSTGIPREYLRTESLYNPPFSYDGIFRSASVPRRIENGHKGTRNMLGFPNMP